jgi:hypothetical protein
LDPLFGLFLTRHFSQGPCGYLPVWFPNVVLTESQKLDDENNANLTASYKGTTSRIIERK